MKRVNKRQALKAWCNGQAIGMIACNMRVGNMWCDIMWSYPNSYVLEPTKEIFDTLVNNFTYYNCNHEMGYYPHFYIKENK